MVGFSYTSFQKERFNLILENLVKIEDSIKIDKNLLKKYFEIIKRKFYTEEEYYRTIFTHLSRKKRLNQGKQEGRGISQYKNIKGNISAEIIYTLLKREKDTLTGYEQELFDLNLIKLNKKELKLLKLDKLKEGIYSTWNIFRSHLINGNDLKLKSDFKNLCNKEKIDINYDSLFTNAWQRLTKEVLGHEIYLKYLSKAQEKHQIAEERRAIGNDYIVHPYRTAYSTHRDLEFILSNRNDIRNQNSIVERKIGSIEEVIDSTKLDSRKNKTLINHLNKSKKILEEEIIPENYKFLNSDLEKHASIITALTHDLGESWIKGINKKIDEITRIHLLGERKNKDYYKIVDKLKRQKTYNTNIIEIRDMARKDFSNEFGIVLAEILSSMTKGDNYKDYIEDMTQSVKLMSNGENLDYTAAWTKINKNKVDKDKIKELRKNLRWIIPYIKIRDCIDNTERIIGLSKSGYSKRITRNIEVLNSFKELLKEDHDLNNDLIKTTYQNLSNLTIKEFNNYLSKFNNNNREISELNLNSIYDYLKNEKYEPKKEKINLVKENGVNDSIIKFDNFVNNLESILDREVKEAEEILHENTFTQSKEIILEKRNKIKSYINEITSNFNEKEKQMANSLVDIYKSYILKAPAIEVVPVEKNSRRIKDIYKSLSQINSKEIYESLPIVLMKNALENLSNYKNESFEKTIEQIKQYMTILRKNKEIKIDSNIFNKYNNLLADKIEEVKTYLNEEIEKGKDQFNLKIEINNNSNYFDPMPKEDIDSMNKGNVKIQMYTQDLENLRRAA